MSSATNNAAAANKKRRFVAPPAAPARPPPTTQHVRLWHQDVSLSTIWYSGSWHCRGRTVLYVDSTSSSAMALHLRRTCRITSLQVETIQNGGGASLDVVGGIQYAHIDPLAHILRKPPTSYTQEEHSNEKEERCDADAQCSRGTSGMFSALRVASIASEAGQVRIVLPQDVSKKTTTSSEQQQNKQIWFNDLQQSPPQSGTAAHDLEARLRERCTETRAARLELVAQRLASSATKSFKITIEYNFGGDEQQFHLGGVHLQNDPAPHIYTTCGVIGDHEGPQHWLPCCDSASSKHRASYTLQIKVTSLCRYGLSTVGCGQDFGLAQAYLHDNNLTNDAAMKLLGQEHVDFLKQLWNTTSSSSSEAHIIPPETTTIDSIYATNIWTSQTWTPAPARSLGFAIGPFKVLEDAEYFSIDEDGDDDEEDDDDDEDAMDWDQQVAALKKSRSNGEGIRQVYFAPQYERKHLLLDDADMSLLPNTDISLQPLGRHFELKSSAIRHTITSATVGVPHRALSLMRDVLALPAYRTTSYTQVWIPNAVHGGSTCGALHSCPEVLTNPFLGGSIMDSRLLPPIGSRLPYHAGGRILQCLQARNAIRGWITAALPLGEHDDVGFGYLFSVMESFLMSLYERGHGAHGEGGAKRSVYFTKRYAVTSGLNSSNLDFLPVHNIEENDYEGLHGHAAEERNNDQLFRTASNGSESHTSGQDEFSIRQTLVGDIIEALERGTDLDKNVPLPSFGWTGSHLSLSFLSSTASSSTELGCGAVELAHPIGGLLYRTLKADVFRRITEGRAGIQNLVRIIRAGFIAAHLDDAGETKLKWEDSQVKNKKDDNHKSSKEDDAKILPLFVNCVDTLLSKGGFTHTLFANGLRTLAGSGRVDHLKGSYADVERNVLSTSTRRQYVQPEGYPNAFVRGASMPYHRLGVHVEPGDIAGGGGAGIKGIQLFVLVEPAIPDGGIAFGGPVTLRVVENNGQLSEIVKSFDNGCRSDWGPITIRAKPVTTAKEQNAASGIIEPTSSAKDKKDKSKDKSKEKEKQKEKPVLVAFADGSAFNENLLHIGGYQALELVRLTNRSPLLWVRVDPQGEFCGKSSIFQPDACVAEQLFHDGEAAAQMEAIRALAERPLRIQGSVKITTVHNVKVAELPVRVLGDCLRGTPALHGDLPHTAGVRVHAALGIGQWQNNKAPSSKDSVDTEAWLGVNLLMQYFKERFFKNEIIMPAKFNRICIKSNDADKKSDAGGKRKADEYVYLDSMEEMVDAEEIEEEEDEEHRVRSAVISAIAAVRAKDGMTPPAVIKFMLAVLEASDESMVGANGAPDEDVILDSIRARSKTNDDGDDKDLRDPELARLHFVPSSVIADALLAVCYINVSASVIMDPVTGKPVQAKMQHPIQPLLQAIRKWLEWELYRETIRTEMDGEIQSGIGGNCYDSVSACGIAALSTLAILRQSTTERPSIEDAAEASKDVATGAQFYMNIFDEEPRRPDVTRAACAQAVACVCCAADRFESPNPPLGLLTSLEYILEKITDPLNSPALRQTLALLMLDVCTGKVSSMQRVAIIGGKPDLCNSGARFYTSPLGASNGNDNGSALLMTVSAASNPTANAVNDGARRGFKLLRSNFRTDAIKDDIVARVATFTTNLWRIINGHRVVSSNGEQLHVSADGVCANDGILRCTLLSLFQWICPSKPHAINKVQSWRSHEGTARYVALGADKVLKVYDLEKEEADAEEKALEPLNKIVAAEIDRQAWRGEMVTKAYEYTMEKGKTSSKDESGVGELLPPVLRDSAFKQGGWVTSTSRQRRAMQLDGGSAVAKIRLTVKGSD